MDPAVPNFPENAFSVLKSNFFIFFLTRTLVFLWYFSTDGDFPGLKGKELIPHAGTAHKLWGMQRACSCTVSSQSEYGRHQPWFSQLYFLNFF